MIWQYLPMISKNIKMNFSGYLWRLCTKYNLSTNRLSGPYNKLFFTVGKHDRTNPEPTAIPVKLIAKGAST